MRSEECTTLIDELLDGLISQEDLQRLEAELESSAESRQAYYERQRLHTVLQAEAETHSEPPTVTRPSVWSEHRRWIIGIAVAASLLLTTGLGWWIGRIDRSDSTSTQSIAQIVHQSGARWVRQRQDGTKVGAGLLQLEVGLARLKFANGVSVTLQGPAEFEIVSGDQARLHSGILTAHVPESAIGFRIETPALQVVDLGTDFGVTVGNDGLTNVSVFEGEVEVNSQAEKSGHVPAQRIVEGQTIRAARLSSTIETVDFETDPFERAWPINSGVLQTTGVMKFVSPGPDFVPGRFEDSEHIVVFPERRGVLLESSLRVDVLEPGEYRRLRDQPALSLATANRVRSYLLQLNPSDRNRTMVMGQITFDNPILGLIASTGKLAESDSVLGHPEGVYEQNRRGIEAPRRDPPGKPDRDTVILAADKRTLILNLGAGSALDQIRVIVDDPNPTWSKRSQ
jgi:ferric-dicitrate binding protein FerR (iron transport regulator)